MIQGITSDQFENNVLCGKRLPMEEVNVNGVGNKTYQIHLTVITIITYMISSESFYGLLTFPSCAHIPFLCPSTMYLCNSISIFLFG